MPPRDRPDALDPPTDATGTAVPVAAGPSSAPARPGLVVVWEAGAPVCRPFAPRESALVVGRSSRADVRLADELVSREHARVGVEGGRLYLEDAGSRAGVVVDGQRVTGRAWLAGGSAVRLADTLLLACDDVGPVERWPVSDAGGYVVGPALASAIAAVELAAQTGRSLVLEGESGAGKEHLARRYHAAGRRPRGPFVEVNCAVLGKELARADLFGARRGAYSGSVEARDGYFVQADGGTLFLDEVGELDLEVQAMLLRVLETGRVTPIGGTAAREVDVAVVAATNRDLRARIASRKFRGDLWARLARSRVHVPPLRARREEIPWLVRLALAAAWDEIARTPRWEALGRRALPTTAGLVEACLLRPWPLNVRELFGAVGDAVHVAVTSEARCVDAPCLPVDAGDVGASGEGDEDAGGATDRHPVATPGLARDMRRAAQAEKDAADLARVLEALPRHGGSVKKAAKEVGVSRARAYRLLEGAGEAGR